MSKTGEKTSTAKIITPVGRISYPRLAKADEKGKFSAAIVFPKGTDITALNKAAIAVGKAKFGDKFAEMVRKKQLRMPFRDGEEKDYPEGSKFFSARSTRKPGVVSRFADPKDPKKPALIPDDQIEETVYPGCQVKLSVTPFYYDKEGNKGIGFALNNVQKWADDERFDSKVSAQDEFDADEEAASLEGLDDGDSDASTDDSDNDLAELLK